MPEAGESKRKLGFISLQNKLFVLKFNAYSCYSSNMVGETVEVTNARINMESQGCTVHTVLVIAAQQSGALWLFHTTLANWHK